jgi:TPR repeat protein
LYEHGQGVDKDVDKAKEYYQKAATKGHYNSVIQLVLLNNPTLKTAAQWYAVGDNYYFGQNGKPKNHPRARACYEKALRIKADQVESLYSLGWLHEYGEGVEKDVEIAKEYYLKAVESGHEDATNHFLLLDNPNFKTGGQWYELGEDYYIPRNGKKKDLNLARACYQQSIHLDPENRFSLYSLGWIYEHGEGVEKDLNKARVYYKKPARKGHYNSIIQLVLLDHPTLKTAEQWYELGEKYYKGEISEVQKYIKARVCYEQAIKLNPEHKNSLYSLGWLYEHRQGLKLDLTKARQYYEKHDNCREELKKR